MKQFLFIFNLYFLQKSFVTLTTGSFFQLFFCFTVLLFPSPKRSYIQSVSRLVGWSIMHKASMRKF